MADILTESYGVADVQRERRRKRMFIIAVTVIVIAAIAYFELRTRTQEHIVAQFLQTLQQQRYQDGYKMWGESRHYSPENYLEDWGPKSKYPDGAGLKVSSVDYCNSDGVVFNLTYPRQEDVALYVNRNTGLISFPPDDWGGLCPGKHLQLGAFFHRLFSSGTPTTN